MKTKKKNKFTIDNEIIQNSNKHCLFATHLSWHTFFIFFHVEATSVFHTLMGTMHKFYNSQLNFSGNNHYFGPKYLLNQRKTTKNRKFCLFFVFCFIKLTNEKLSTMISSSSSTTVIIINVDHQTIGSIIIIEKNRESIKWNKSKIETKLVIGVLENYWFLLQSRWNSSHTHTDIWRIKKKNLCREKKVQSNKKLTKVHMSQHPYTFRYSAIHPRW